ncbi:MAG: hypothetical protein CM15mP58_22640 [Burkholderiaceae bacterium]|nr:MAG: hypothetical protein CM15mP58_22640 [Burkholderiaceae bacterium]
MLIIFKAIYEEEIGSSGVLYIKDEMYIYDNEKQFIKYVDGFITTINKPIKQVVYDSINKNDITIFDILTGNNNSINIDDEIIENNKIRILFNIEQWGIKGSIYIRQQDGSPEKVIFIQDEDLKIHIDIKSIANRAEFNLPKYDISDYEVINLIE